MVVMTEMNIQGVDGYDNMNGHIRSGWLRLQMWKYRKWLVMMTEMEIQEVAGYDDKDGNIGSGWL